MPRVSRDAAVGDFDHDGNPDILDGTPKVVVPVHIEAPEDRSIK
jgi:hypothetical protein